MRTNVKNKNKKKYNAVDLFSGCGGLSEGMRNAGFNVRFAVEIDFFAAKAYALNHPETTILKEDIRGVNPDLIHQSLNGEPLHLLAGCPPCQGFSTMRTLNKQNAVWDKRNDLVREFLRFVLALNPMTIMMENVPGLKDYPIFRQMCDELSVLYTLSDQIVDIKNYGVPQRRKRLVLIGAHKSLNMDLKVAESTGERVTVRDCIGSLPPADSVPDPIHKAVMNHSERIKTLISLIPKNGGGRDDLPENFVLKCHKRKNIGFHDVYGRLRWDDYSSTITGGCINPSKGRFLHPEEDRAITPREASLLQTFPPGYRFPEDIPKPSLALMIGNSLPPRFSYIQCRNIKSHLDKLDDGHIHP